MRFVKAPPDRVVRSNEQSHPAIISIAMFTEAQRQRQVRGVNGQQAERAGRKSKYPSALRGRVRCALCGRKMEAAPRDGVMRFSCRARNSVPGEVRDKHPPSIYVREAGMLTDITTWLSELLRPEKRIELLATVLAGQGGAPLDPSKLEAAQARLDAANLRMSREIEAIDAGIISPALVERLNASERERVAAEAELADPGELTRLVEPEIADAIERLPTHLTESDAPDELQPLFEEVGLVVSFDGPTRSARFAATICGVTIASTGADY
jgi:hypothetical protein